MTEEDDSRARHEEEHVKKNRVFILGAGFSKAAGIPLTIPLLEKAMHKFSKECEGLFRRIDRYARESVEYYGNDPLDYSKVDFSGLCTFLEYIELREYGGGERWKDEGSREKLALRYYLSKTIVEHTPIGDNIPQLYLDFSEQLHERDVVISFNWDGLLEIALEKTGKAYTYNWDDDKAIKLCKLHGSVNWRLNEPSNPSGPVNTLNWKSLKFTDGMMEHEIYHTPCLLDFNTWNHYSPLGEVDPFLVLPGYGKAFDVRSNAVLWNKPELAFSTAHDVYIIGLSLAPDDFFIRSLFLSNLSFIDSYLSVAEREIHIINPDKNASTNYDFLLSKGVAELLNEKFDIKHIELMKDRLKHA